MIRAAAVRLAHSVLLVELAALKEGHQVDLFLAGEGAVLIGDDAIATVEGKGTGNLGQHYQGLVAGGARFHVSGMSAKSRGMTDADLVGKPAEFAMPDVLVRLAVAADVAVTYWCDPPDLVLLGSVCAIELPLMMSTASASGFLMDFMFRLLRS